MLKQAFVSNGYSNTEFDKILNNYSTTTSLNSNVSPHPDVFNTAGTSAPAGMGAPASMKASAGTRAFTVYLFI